MKQLQSLADRNVEQMKRRATEVQSIILSDFSKYHTVEQLAQKVSLPEQKLQIIFKSIFGMTVGRFSREQRLKKAHEILMSGDETLLSVAMATGYGDISNFSTAFKKYFGYSPGYLRKIRRNAETAAINSAIVICG